MMLWDNGDDDNSGHDDMMIMTMAMTATVTTSNSEGNKDDNAHESEENHCDHDSGGHGDNNDGDDGGDGDHKNNGDDHDGNDTVMTVMMITTIMIPNPRVSHSTRTMDILKVAHCTSSQSRYSPPGVWHWPSIRIPSNGPATHKRNLPKHTMCQKHQCSKAHAHTNPAWSPNSSIWQTRGERRLGGRHGVASVDSVQRSHSPQE